jgi:hypothetical protein
MLSISQVFLIARYYPEQTSNLFVKVGGGYVSVVDNKPGASNSNSGQGFRRYLSDDRVPYYVNDFIRKNKKHIDEIRTSIFQFNL